MYVYRVVEKVVEEDEWETGCKHETATLIGMDLTIRGETVPDLVSNICDFFGVDANSVMVNSCGDPGRIDVQILEDEDGNELLGSRHDAWRQGKYKAYLADYIGYTTIEKPAGML